MTDDGAKQDTSNKNVKLAEEILDHAEFLLDSTLTRQQRDHLSRIRLAAQGLSANLKDENGKNTLTKKNGFNLSPEEEIIPSLQVLLAEDNPFTQKLMSRLLTQNNHTVDITANGQEALEKFIEGQYDLIIMDIGMPILDGIEATKAIRKHQKSLKEKKIPIIAVTALVGKEDKKRILAAGIDGYHSKPVRSKILNQEIIRVLGITPNGNKMNKAKKETKEQLVRLDVTSLLKTVDNDWSLIQEITDLFFTDAPKQMERIKTAIETNDTTELLEAAHSLKGAAGAFGDSIVYDLAYELEQLGRSNTTVSAQESHTLLNEALASMEENLQTILAQKGDYKS
ncbi:MAG: response regulator [Magnetococcales bacterium]|nr:response regulator [Magnetococcales bacterium]